MNPTTVTSLPSSALCNAWGLTARLILIAGQRGFVDCLGPRLFTIRGEFKEIESAGGGDDAWAGAIDSRELAQHARAVGLEAVEHASLDQVADESRRDGGVIDARPEIGQVLEGAAEPRALDRGVGLGRHAAHAHESRADHAVFLGEGELAGVDVRREQSDSAGRRLAQQHTQEAAVGEVLREHRGHEGDGVMRLEVRAAQRQHCFGDARQRGFVAAGGGTPHLQHGEQLGQTARFGLAQPALGGDAFQPGDAGRVAAADQHPGLVVVEGDLLGMEVGVVLQAHRLGGAVDDVERIGRGNLQPHETEAVERCHVELTQG
jgi:hypothetical protein